MKTRLLFVVMGVAVAGCTVYKVDPLPQGMGSYKIMVVDNPAVVMDDFGPRLATEFRSRGFEVDITYGCPVAEKNRLFASFTARRSFNFLAPYPWLSYVDVTLTDKDGRMVAKGLYRHRHCFWSFAFKRFCRCSRSKLRPLFSEMFKNYPRVSQDEF